MKAKIGWWKLYTKGDDTRVVVLHNYHVLSSNGNILLSTSQGYSNKTDMFYIIESLFPNHIIKQEPNRYSKPYSYMVKNIGDETDV